MNIKWNKVTTLSKTLALIIFIVFPFIGFYLGVQYGEMTTSIKFARMEIEQNNAFSKKIIMQDPNKPADTSLRVISPNGNQTFCIGQAMNIAWEHKDIGSVTVWVEERMAGSSNGLKRLVGNYPGDFNETGAMGSGMVSWKVNVPEGYAYEVLMFGRSSSRALEISDTSDNVFQVVNCAGQMQSSF